MEAMALLSKRKKGTKCGEKWLLLIWSWSWLVVEGTIRYKNKSQDHT
jgi:hypothetical protein